MTTFLLIRHGETDANGQSMAGWLPGCHLNAKGQLQASRLAQRLANLPIRAIYTSPLERAIETAEPLAKDHRILPTQLQDLGEIHIGEWEGMSFADLEKREDWRRFNTFRSGSRPPGGESMLEVQMRMVRQIECLRARHTGETVTVISHCDPLRSLIAHFLGIPLDLMLRLEISPGSLSVIQWNDWGARVMCLNDSELLPV